MYSRLKKSIITHWWVAKSNSKMAFVNILSGEELSEDLLVVGYFNKEREELATSANSGWNCYGRKSLLLEYSFLI